MKFPIINISYEKWNSEDLMEYVCYDEFIYTKKDSLFDKFYKNKFFCDGNGKIFKAVKKAEMTESWRNWFKFIPNVWKTKIVFVKMNDQMSLEKLRSYVLDRISGLEENEFTQEWKETVLKASNYSELICGKKI